MRNLLPVFVVVGALAGCVRAVESPIPEARPTSAASAPPLAAASHEDPEQAAALRGIAASYASKLTKVNPSLHVAPTLCAAPGPPPSALRASKSGDAATHGKKVYYLYAAHDDAYLRDAGHAGTTQPADQVLVKEAWAAVPADEAGGAVGERHEVVDVDGKSYRAGERGSLFVMDRAHGAWRFGLVAPDGTVTTEGAATKSCHGCHDARPDGLFGLAR